MRKLLLIYTLFSSAMIYSQGKEIIQEYTGQKPYTRTNFKTNITTKGSPNSSGAKGCGNAGFYDITAGSPYHCNDTIWLTAWDSATAGGYINPAWEFTVVTDQYDENVFNAYENGVLFYSDNPDENVTQSYYGGFMDPTATYTAEWCDSYGDGSFDWSITDLTNDVVLYSGT